MKSFSFEETAAFLPFRLARTARDTLQEFIDIDVRASDLVRILEHNQAYRDLLFRFIEKKPPSSDATAKKKKTAADASEPAAGAADVIAIETDSSAPAAPEADKKEREEPPSPTYRLIHTLGMIGVRNVILALRIHKMVEGSFPVSAEGQVDFRPAEFLPLALGTEEIFQNNELEYGETAFASALFFDLCLGSLKKDKDGFKKLEPYCKRVWQRAFRCGMVAYFLAQETEIVSPKDALAAGQLIHIGKLQLLGKFGFDYAEFESAMDLTKELPPLACFLIERERFGVCSEEFGSHSLRFFGLFPQIVEGIRCYREPYLLKEADPAGYSLALFLWLADAMTRSWKLPVDEQDPVFQEWANPALKSLKISKQKLLSVMTKAMEIGG